jgi:ribosomal protein S25
MPDPESQEVLDALFKIKAITPSQVANEFNIKVSVAKKFLKNLHEKGVIELIAQTNNLKVYKSKS